jgi:hypothetical protein
MSPALLRRLAPLSLFLVPLLAPLLVTSSNASTLYAVPSAAHGVRFGTSLGTNTSQTLHLFPKPDVVRIFWSSPKAQLPSMPSTAALWVSFKSLPSASAFGSMLQAWNKSGRTVYWTYYHEADRSNISASRFKAGWSSLLAVEKKYPSTRVKSMSIFTGIMLAPNHPHGSPESWYVNADILGFDCYVPASVPRAMAYAKAKHKPWAIPEFGADNGDLGNITYIKSTIASWAAYPPVGVSWYNHTAAASFSQPLSSLPKTTTYLQTLASAS